MIVSILWYVKFNIEYIYYRLFFVLSTWNSSMLLTEDILKNVMASGASKEKSNKDTSNEIEFEDV
jgi:hypothetical protein